jgi:hypothetical protein
MSTNGQSGGTPFQTSTRGAHYVVFAARVLASPLEVCLRRGFGPKYFGLQAVGTLLLFPLWTVFWPRDNPAALYGFWAIVMFCFARARAESTRMVAKGDVVHTRYNGTSRLTRFFKRLPEAKVKGTCEPACGLVAGALLMQLDKPLGSIIVVSAVAMFLVQATIEGVEQARVSDLNDALIEQQSIAERFREMQRDQWRR